MKRSTGLRSTVLTIIIALLLGPLPPADHRAMAQAGPSQTDGDTIRLPLVSAPGEPSGTPPDFRIISPAEGMTVSGTSFFAVQPLGASEIATVAFQAGATTLGTDSTSSDGFQVFLDASQLPAGPLQLTAIATGPTGETATKTVNVTVVANPPASAVVGASGTTLATASGSTIVVPPGAVSGEATISVEDKTQEEVTAEKGLDWDAMGVTFLGAIDVQSTTPLAQPLGVSSVGFGSRVQEGQAVVTYRILPDADGDGVGELVVINGANLAPNGTIVSSPVPEIVVNNISVNGVRSATAAQGELRGPPGTTITIEGAGLNPFSLHGNVGIWTSLVDNQVFELPGMVLPDPDDSSRQIFSTLIPPLPVGDATLMLVNRSTGSMAGPFNVSVEASEPLDRPGVELFDLFLVDTIDYLAGLPTSTPEQAETINSTIEGLTQVRAEFQALVDVGLTPEETQIMDTIALMIANSSFYQVGAASIAGYGADAIVTDVLAGLGGIALILGGIAAVPAATTLFTAFVALFSIYLGLAMVGFIVCRLLTAGNCFGEPPAPEEACTPTSMAAGTGGGTTGMGAAPPPGGDSCGNVGGGPANSVQSASLAQFEPGRFIVKIFPLSGGGLLTPFTGATDPGGYFYIPLIPEGEPFRALATDQLTGASVSVEGVGPATGESTMMYFDFTDAQENRFDIAVGDTITNGVPGPGAGNIEEAGGLDIYAFNATAGQRVYFDVLELDINVSWQLLDPSGAALFDTCLACGDPGAFTLAQSGTYIIRVGDDNNEEVGTYQFKLWDVPAPDEFAIAVGDTITNGVPGPGAGHIESPGVLDIYTFDVAAGQRVFFDVLELEVNIQWELLDPSGAVIFRTCSACGDPGAFTLTEAGTYTLNVGDNNNDATGIYQVKLWNVPASDEFTIAVGDTITNGVPGPGAGNIESPGVLDIYSFEATAGQSVFFDVLEFEVNIQWELLDPSGAVIFRTCLACGDPGAFTLAQAGTYTITVGDNNNDATGIYQFKLEPQ